MFMSTKRKVQCTDYKMRQTTIQVILDFVFCGLSYNIYFVYIVRSMACFQMFVLSTILTSVHIHTLTRCVNFFFCKGILSHVIVMFKLCSVIPILRPFWGTCMGGDFCLCNFSLSYLFMCVFI